MQVRRWLSDTVRGLKGIDNMNRSEARRGGLELLRGAGEGRQNVIVQNGDLF